MLSETGAFVYTQRTRNTLNIKKSKKPQIKIKATQGKNYSDTSWYLGHDFTFAVLLPLALIQVLSWEKTGARTSSPRPISSLLEDGDAFDEFEFSYGCVLLVAALPPLLKW